MTFQPSSPTAEAQGRSAEGPSASSSDMSTPEIGATARRTRTVTQPRHRAVHRDHRRPQPDPLRRRTWPRAAGSAGSSCRAASPPACSTRVVAEQLPGPGSVFLEVSWQFRAPVRPGDEITAEATVTSVREDKPVTTLATRITNQDGVVVLDGTAVVWRDPVVRSVESAVRPRNPQGRPREGRLPSVLPTHQPRRNTGTNTRRNTMTVTTENPRINGVDTATLFATLDAVKGQHRDRQVPVPRHATPGSAARTAGRRSPASTARCRRCSTSTRPRSTPTTRRCSSAQDNGPTPVEYLLHAHRGLPDRRASPTSPPPAASS